VCGFLEFVVLFVSLVFIMWCVCCCVSVVFIVCVW